MRKVVPYALIIITLLAGCERQIPFEHAKWMEGADTKYPYRNSMVNDLVQHYKLKGLSKKEWTELLGDPDGTDSLSVFYTILIHYDVIDPDHGKDLVIELNADSSVQRFSINEWGKHSGD